MTYRRKKLLKVWSSAEWKANKLKFLESHPKCSMPGCERKSEVPHHPHMESYKGVYLDLEASGAVAYCKKCHFALHKGLKLCIWCKEHYCRWDADMCKPCWEKDHPELKAQREAMKEKWKRIRRDNARKFRKKLKEQVSGKGSPKASRTTQSSLSQAPQKGQSGQRP